MNKILYKYILYFITLVLSFIIILAFSCTISDIKKIADDPDFKPKWDTNIRALIFDKETSPISLGEYVEDKVLTPYDESISGLSQWPVPVAVGPANYTGALPVDPNIDIDGGGADFVLDGYYAPRSDLIIMRIWLTNDDTGDVLLINPSTFTIGSVEIEGTTVTFSGPVSQDNKLVYTSTNFLSSVNEYYLDLGGDNDIDVSFNNVSLNAGAAVYSGASSYTFNIQLVFNLGSDFGIVGEITNSAVLYSITGQDIPINDLPVDKLNNFRLEFEYNSSLPFDLDINTTFYGSDKTPSPSSFNTTIASGILSTSPMHGYQFVSSYGESSDKFKFNDNVLSYGDMKLDLSFLLPTPTGTKIRLDTDTLIRVKIIASADATISL